MMISLIIAWAFSFLPEVDEDVVAALLRYSLYALLLKSTCQKNTCVPAR